MMTFSKKAFMAIVLTIAPCSFSNIIIYNLFTPAYLIDDGTFHDLSGVLILESTGVQRLQYVDFKVHDFFLSSPSEVLFHSNDARIKFMTTSDMTEINYTGDRLIVSKNPTPGFYLQWLTETPDDGSLEFSPESFEIWNDDFITREYSWGKYKFGWLKATIANPVNPVDEPSIPFLFLSALLIFPFVKRYQTRLHG